MYRYTANGNYNVREHFGVPRSVFDKELTLDQKNQTKNWIRAEATLPNSNQCRSFWYESPIKCTWKNGRRICKDVKCTWIDDTEKCTLDIYGRQICNIKKKCQEGGTELKYCKEKGPICFNSKPVEDMCCDRRTTHFGFINENGNKKKYCAWQGKN